MIKRILLILTVLCMFNIGCVSDTSNNTNNNSNTNSVTNSANQPSYPFFTPWWVK